MSTELNIHREHSRLEPALLARWQGLPLCWLDASGSAFARDFITERPLLALLDAGAAEADIAFVRRSAHLDVSEGAIGLFEPGETRFSRWRCRWARRIIVEVDLPWLVARGLVPNPGLALALRQNLEFRDPPLASLMRAMVREVADGCPNGQLFAESLSLGLVRRVASTHGEGTAAQPERGKLTAAQLRRVDEYIDAQLGNPIPLVSIAEVAGLSPAHFARLFRNAVACSPHQYVLGKRVDRARSLLERSELPIAAVASATGFANQSHMNAVFLQRLGATPGALRRGNHWQDTGRTSGSVERSNAVTSLPS